MEKEKKIKVKKKIDWIYYSNFMGGIYIHVTWMDHSSQSFYYNRYLCRKSIEIPVGTTL